jgi:hypothetical protein
MAEEDAALRAALTRHNLLDTRLYAHAQLLFESALHRAQMARAPALLGSSAQLAPSTTTSNDATKQATTLRQPSAGNAPSFAAASSVSRARAPPDQSIAGACTNVTYETPWRSRPQPSAATSSTLFYHVHIPKCTSQQTRTAVFPAASDRLVGLSCRL